MKIEKILKLLQETAEYERLNSAEELYKTVKKMNLIGVKNPKDKPKFLTEIEEILLKALADNPQHTGSLTELTNTQLQIGKTILPTDPARAIIKADSVLGRETTTDQRADAYLIKAQAAIQLQDQKLQFESLLSATRLMKEPPLELLTQQAMLLQPATGSTQTASDSQKYVPNETVKEVNELFIKGYERMRLSGKVSESDHRTAALAYSRLKNPLQHVAALARAIAMNPENKLNYTDMENAINALPNHTTKSAQQIKDLQIALNKTKTETENKETQLKSEVAKTINSLKAEHAKTKKQMQDTHSQSLSQVCVDSQRVVSRFKLLSTLLGATTLVSALFVNTTCQRNNALENETEIKTSDINKLEETLSQERKTAETKETEWVQMFSEQAKNAIDDAKRKKTESDIAYAALERDKNGLQERIEKINSDPEKVSRAEYNLLKSERDTYKEESDALQKKYDSLIAAKNALETDLEAKISSIKELTAAEKDKSDQIIELDKKIAAGEETRAAEKAKLIAEYDTKVQEKETIKQQLDQAQKEINQYKSNTRVALLEKDLGETKTKLETATNMAGELEKKLEGAVAVSFLDKAYDKNTNELNEKYINSALEWSQTPATLERIALLYGKQFEDTQDLLKYFKAVDYFEKAVAASKDVTIDVSFAKFVATRGDLPRAIEIIVEGLRKPDCDKMKTFECDFITRHGPQLSQEQRELLEKEYRNSKGKK